MYRARIVPKDLTPEDAAEVRAWQERLRNMDKKQLPKELRKTRGWAMSNGAMARPRGTIRPSL